jgi:excinuclease ABC subunit A
MTENQIIITEINHHNFKNVSLSIPKNKLIIFTGPSGSGKSTLVIDIIYAESQRKFIESLPLYARQFIGLPEKAQIKKITGLTPAIAIDQKTSSSNSRSTVGTMSEIYEYIRTLYATIGTQFCPSCNIIVAKKTENEIITELKEIEKDTTEVILFIETKKNTTKEKEHTIMHFLEKGFTLFLCNNKVETIRTKEDLKKKKKELESQDIGVIFFKGLLSSQEALADAIKRAFEFRNYIAIKTDNHLYKFSHIFQCVRCFKEFETLTPRLFSFNLPTGACQTCKGLGTKEEELKSIIKRDFNLLFESDDDSDFCSGCKGGRLNKQALSVFINEKNIYDYVLLPIHESISFLEEIKKNNQQLKNIIEPIINEIEKRISILIDLGIGYLDLARPSHTLSGGEAQRIRLSSQLGSGLTGVTYVLDEPSIGLHQKDNRKLIRIMKQLRDIGNTVLVIEHDEETMISGDMLIDVGPGAGTAGGNIVYQGTPENIKNEPASITGAFLTGEKTIARKGKIKEASEHLEIKNATKHNLKNLNFKLPLGVITVISGPSGCGKSTLVFSEIIPQIERAIREKDPIMKNYESIIVIDQTSLGKTSRSTIGTYLGLFDHIRELFSHLPESKIAGYTAGSFSFNTGQGRCQKCLGKGEYSINLDPLPPTIALCSVCQGKRYSKNILQITYQGKSIYDVLQMTVKEAALFFRFHRKIVTHLDALSSVGLEYITLDQSSDTFSGGEAQRVKLAFELHRRKKNTVYILDEPTTGLHFQDIKLLLTIFEKMTEQNNTVIIIEHNLSIIKNADFVIDLGPEGGSRGGFLLATGTPEEIKKNKESVTGPFL